MAIRIAVTFRSAPGKGDEYAAAWLPITKQTQTEPGCEQYEVFRSGEDADKFVLLERWTTAEDLEVHMGVLRDRGPSPTAPYRDESFPTVFERYEV
ncbi:MAG TPA: antibiotic biosynthesis monooxygenase family protein [Dehalococcoidia bacterium]|nr:antibiotic biosynthesis monooxygenase family protein [Dehalococcoidia bacterium]